MEQGKKLLGFYNYTVILTYLGMLSGFAGIIQVFEGRIFVAVVCLMISGLCDMFDGAVASTKVRTDQEKCFGIQIDSLSDLVCFGVLPALIVYGQSGKNLFVMAVSGLYLLCALIRLAYFNVDEQERQKTSSTSRKVYYGLPVTLSALFLPLVHGISCLCSWKTAAVPTAVLMLMAAMFLIPFQLKKPGKPGKIAMVVLGLLEAGLLIYACAGV